MAGDEDEPRYEAGIVVSAGHDLSIEAEDELPVYGPLVEPRISRDVQAELTRRGHDLNRVGEYNNVPWIEVAGIDPATGFRYAACDPREDDRGGALGQV